MTAPFVKARLILASGSAARRALMSAAGLEFEVRPAAIDEDEVKGGARAEGMSADDTAMLLAEMKAMRVARSVPDAVVIGADQLLVCEDRWFDKPTNAADARAQLQALRGRSHTLVTAVLCQRGGQRLRVGRRRCVKALLTPSTGRGGWITKVKEVWTSTPVPRRCARRSTPSTDPLFPFQESLYREEKMGEGRAARAA